MSLGLSSSGESPPGTSPHDLSFQWVHDQRPEEHQDQRRALLWSTGLHFLVLSLSILAVWVFPSKPRMFLPTLRVDLVGLPDVLKKDLKQIQPPPASPAEIERARQRQLESRLKKVKEDAQSIQPDQLPASPSKSVEPAQPDEMTLKPKRQGEAPSKKERAEKLKGALARIRALERMRDATAEKPHATGNVVKGNIVSPGKSLSSDAKESLQSTYYDEIRDRLQSNWSLPVWLARQNLSAQISLQLDLRGRLSSLRFLKSSGNPSFDEAVTQAVRASQPFPLPPEEIRSQILVNGIMIGFPL